LQIAPRMNAHALFLLVAACGSDDDSMLADASRSDAGARRDADGIDAGEISPGEDAGRSGGDAGTRDAAPPPPCEEGASALGPIAAELDPGEWIDVTGRIAAFPEFFYDLGSSIFAYTNEAYWHSDRREVVFIGEGHHSNYDGDPATHSRFMAYRDCRDEWMEREIITASGPGGEAGTIGHQYHHSALAEDEDLFFHVPYGGAALFEYDFAGSSWRRIERPSSIAFGLAVWSSDITFGVDWFPERNGIFLYSAGAGAFFHDRASGEWSTIAEPVGAELTLDEVSIYNPVRGEVLFGGGQGAPEVFALRASGGVVTLPSSPAPMSAREGIVTVDPVSGDYLFFRDGSFWTFDGVAWREQPSAPPFATQGTDGTVAVSIDTYGVVLVMRWPEQVWMYRHD
jgi:hypothetical protein